MGKIMTMNPLSPIHYTAIGDSITVGIGSLFNYGYAHQYRDFIKKEWNAPVAFRNLGKAGWTSQQLLHALKNDASFFKAIQIANIITCSIGGNDLIQAGRVYDKTKNKEAVESALQNFRLNFLSIDRSIKSIKKSSHTPYIIHYIEVYNPKPEFSLAQQWVKKLNQTLHKAADSHTKIAPVYAAFLHHENTLLFVDGKHPNYKGHRLIAETIRSVDYKL
ncbi:GDSL-type esterase/lipase family protein [Aneurinibacillus aneurinilyticus]|uniref:SGNH hydrolase-type esterase domain-containing protein n=2 Tax=Aneurinibacillus aneurinilyticus TaxID=1391 RepID=A0A848D435_ANEAE|nr:GDSL-type esterase/lipase family protein [Aneurinibacillus aneurinilyticus]ERI10735.1 GDSL-like protein [Aneurinibacillus aneurinilyticus ATCC 12856]MED0709258.1 GDSL-type esterase/lipase family protein [Aneurinibacillus aneurinilyticus]MED0724888.1 GDSL-type esterase/lipase family protein [Aneurinibacillus aneurinilyticus]MED0732497.1 GDSL-type esterase/lipase family protein [Aneurinibacillus aneurinilyticus]MED0741780.1 GDSL-type esterase/lipase family protein [Aneurinibacillus aneurinily